MATNAKQVEVLTATGYELVSPCQLPSGPELLLMGRPPNLARRGITAAVPSGRAVRTLR